MNNITQLIDYLKSRTRFNNYTDIFDHLNQILIDHETSWDQSNNIDSCNPMYDSIK